MTYSIVALDAPTGELGAAVQTCWPSVGATVPWVWAGVGAVATQSFTNVDLGPWCLERLREGESPAEALAQVLATDPGREVRQVGVVDTQGRTAVHTGRQCVPFAGQVTAEGVSIQGNMLADPAVWSVMLEAFQRHAADLAERLLAALEAGERAGGDVRGRRSAALVIAPGGPANAWARRFDVRVDDSSDPLAELDAALRRARAYEALDSATEALVDRGPGAALESSGRALALAPDDPQIGLWHGALLHAAGRSTEARPVVELALRRRPELRRFADRFAAAGHEDLLARAVRSLDEPADDL